MANFLSHDGSRSFASSTKRCVLLFLITLCIGNILVHVQAEASAAVCTDRKKKIKLDGKVLQFCKWCAEDPDTRCTQIKIKKKRKKKRKKKKKKRIIYNPKKLCPCTCADYLEDPPIDDSDKIETALPCPEDLDPAADYSEKVSCMRDGYQKGRVCKYNWAWALKDCSSNELSCQSHRVCTCKDDYWFCKTWTSQSTIEICNVTDRPGDDGVPEKAGDVCEPPPEDPPTEVPIDGPNKIETALSCPVDLEIVFGSNTSRSSVRNTQISCMRDGYERGQVCSYDWKWRGCRYNTLYCQPDLVCTCATGDQDVWSCYQSTIETCEKKERPGEDGIEPPYYVPEETGTVCVKGETPPEPACPTEQYMNNGLGSGDKPPCMTDTYQEGQVCSYNYSWRGCTYPLYCGPGRECECEKNSDSDSSGRESWSWTCKDMLIESCGQSDRPDPDVPEEVGDVCDPDETLLIRRRLRQ